MKLLNLDEIQTVKRQVKLFGTTYNIEQQSVGQMIEGLQMSKLAEKDDNEAIFQSMVRVAKYSIPDAPDEVIHRLSLTQLQTLLNFLNTPDEEITEETNDSEGNKTAKK